jgi:hypothetical protein
LLAAPSPTQGDRRKRRRACPVSIPDEETAGLYPRLEDLRARRRALDRAGHFLNDHLRGLFA